MTPPTRLPRGLPAALLGIALAAATAAGIPTAAGAASKVDVPTGPVGKTTGLPVPRYASLKTDRVNLREGPSKDNRTAWVFQRAGLPVEITAEFETWRRIRDSEGTEGWVLHSLLSGRRTAVVQPWAKPGTAPLALFDKPDESTAVVAQLQPNVIANVKGCTGAWCRVIVVRAGARDLTGFMKQDKLWGVYPNEKVD